MQSITAKQIHLPSQCCVTMCSVAHALGWLICTFAFNGFCFLQNADTHGLSTCKNQAGRLAEDREPCLDWHHSPCTTHIRKATPAFCCAKAERQQVALHHVIQGSHTGQLDPPPPRMMAGLLLISSVCEACLGCAAVQGAHHVCPIQDLQHCTGVSDGCHFHCLQHCSRALHCGEFLLPACMHVATHS